MSRREYKDAQLLCDVRDFCVDIVKRTKGLKFPEFVADSDLRDIISLKLIYLGEAANRLTDKTKSSLSDVPWQSVIGLRNIVAHDYRDINLPVIWHVVKKDIPELLRLLEGVA